MIMMIGRYFIPPWYDTSLERVVTLVMACFISKQETHLIKLII